MSRAHRTTDQQQARAWQRCSTRRRRATASGSSEISRSGVWRGFAAAAAAAPPQNSTGHLSSGAGGAGVDQLPGGDSSHLRTRTRAVIAVHIWCAGAPRTPPHRRPPAA
eukprot:SAG31_NODE_266_length_18815_cov_17.009243_6_plen_109_part_00